MREGFSGAGAFAAKRIECAFCEEYCGLLRARALRPGARRAKQRRAESAESRATTAQEGVIARGCHASYSKFQRRARAHFSMLRRMRLSRFH